MNYILALAVVLSAVPSFVSAGPVDSVELRLDGDRAVAHYSRCREFVNDFPQQCESERTIAMPELKVDRAARTISLDGAVVARWGRLGPWVKLERGWRLKHETVDGRASVRLVRKGA